MGRQSFGRIASQTNLPEIHNDHEFANRSFLMVELGAKYTRLFLQFSSPLLSGKHYSVYTGFSFSSFLIIFRLDCPWLLSGSLGFWGRGAVGGCKKLLT